ncbi:MAG: cation diffusion facilitator family transporter [Bacteroidia bacterium]|nr:cation diffusion facilitator family transporter [Bacteroidia bacterium]
MGKHHHNHPIVTGKNLVLPILLNMGITLAQIIGGLVSGSMALLSDAAHNFSDVLALIFSYIAAKLSGRERTLKQTFGYKRAGIFAAFINAATLMIIATVLVQEAIERLMNPRPIEGEIVIYLAALGILFNGASALLVKKGAKSDINMRSAYLHLFTDMLTSIAVFIGGFAISYLGWFWVDGVLTIAISIYLIYSSWEIFYESMRIFMQFTPTQINIEEIAAEITLIQGVKNVHHVHAWKLDDHEMMFEAHLDLEEDYTISHFELILEKVSTTLHRFDIHHFNIQPEWVRDDEKALINRLDH